MSARNNNLGRVLAATGISAGLICLLLFVRRPVGVAPTAVADGSESAPVISGADPTAVANPPPSRGEAPPALPTFSAIATRVREATAPAGFYRVRVHQTQEEAASQPANATGPARLESRLEMRYDAHTREFSVTKNEAPVPSQGSISVTVNTTTFLDEMAGWQHVAVRPLGSGVARAYQISADTLDGAACELEVDARSWFVSHLKFWLKGSLFADTTFQYRQINGYWMPATIAITTGSGRSRTLLEFGDYDVTFQ